ncbi:MAG TPA: type III pantothenate kinase [Paenalcaligenes sp.]|nr:type III pantothenate kinase [Paenalcaligenes sp.]
MKVLLDLGNTRLKAGLLHPTTQGPELATTFATSYDQPRALSQWLERTLLKDPDRQIQALGISVVSERTRHWVENILLAHQCQVQWLDACTPSTIVHNAYEAPTQLGADRWFGALGAFYQLNPRPAQALVYCSFGTATTIDTIVPQTGYSTQEKRSHKNPDESPDNPIGHRSSHHCSEQPAPPKAKPWIYLGGLILPGPYLMYQSLDQHTARLSLGQGALQDFPVNTRSAISSGIAAAQTGALSQQIRRAQQRCPEHPVLVVCSGGGWPLIATAVDRLFEQWPQLHSSGPLPQLHYYEHSVLLGLGSTLVQPNLPLG